MNLVAEFPETLPLAHADIGLIERAMQNLIDNAITYSDRGDSITLEIIPQTDRITVRVSDEGKGIDKEDLPYIFDRFYQGKRREKDLDDDSTGLGLAITKRILDLHGSSIGVESELDKGTRFTFDLNVYSTAS